MRYHLLHLLRRKRGARGSVRDKNDDFCQIDPLSPLFAFVLGQSFGRHVGRNDGALGSGRTPGRDPHDRGRGPFVDHFDGARGASGNLPARRRRLARTGAGSEAQARRLGRQQRHGPRGRQRNARHGKLSPPDRTQRGRQRHRSAIRSARRKRSFFGHGRPAAPHGDGARRRPRNVCGSLRHDGRRERSEGSEGPEASPGEEGTLCALRRARLRGPERVRFDAALQRDRGHDDLVDRETLLARL